MFCFCVFDFCSRGRKPMTRDVFWTFHLCVQLLPGPGSSPLFFWPPSGTSWQRAAQMTCSTFSLSLDRDVPFRPAHTCTKLIVRLRASERRSNVLTSARPPSSGAPLLKMLVGSEDSCFFFFLDFYHHSNEERNLISLTCQIALADPQKIIHEPVWQGDTVKNWLPLYRCGGKEGLEMNENRWVKMTRPLRCDMSGNTIV